MKKEETKLFFPFFILQICPLNKLKIICVKPTHIEINTYICVINTQIKNMLYTSDNKLPLQEQGNQSIFLAGSMDTNINGNWRQDVINRLDDDYNFFDPTNNNHSTLHNYQMRAHIKWELDALKMADKIILNFIPNAQSPISLVELGLHVATSKLIVICPKEFYKYRYVNVLCKEYDTPFFHSINEALDTLNTKLILS